MVQVPLREGRVHPDGDLRRNVFDDCRILADRAEQLLGMRPSRCKPAVLNARVEGRGEQLILDGSLFPQHGVPTQLHRAAVPSCIHRVLENPVERQDVRHGGGTPLRILRALPSTKQGLNISGGHREAVPADMDLTVVQGREFHRAAADASRVKAGKATQGVPARHLWETLPERRVLARDQAVLVLTPVEVVVHEEVAEGFLSVAIGAENLAHVEQRRDAAAILAHGVCFANKGRLLASVDINFGCNLATLTFAALRRLALGLLPSSSSSAAFAAPLTFGHGGEGAILGTKDVALLIGTPRLSGTPSAAARHDFVRDGRCRCLANNLPATLDLAGGATIGVVDEEPREMVQELGFGLSITNSILLLLRPPPNASAAVIGGPDEAIRGGGAQVQRRIAASPEPCDIVAAQRQSLLPPVPRELRCQRSTPVLPHLHSDGVSQCVEPTAREVLSPGPHLWHLLLLVHVPLLRALVIIGVAAPAAPAS
mmetsp:Transcript_17950/g.38250  ORF Transcript_17950/g.38250 Transcript_17950/m.38250 type:complete len:484 (+) Transcript_17950:450-1901(+)